jgi:hypothetical protein
MNERDDSIREKLIDRLASLSIDARNLAVEVNAGLVTVRGSVPTEEERQRTAVRPVAARDSLDERGRSPVTGTSAESAHKSRHQTDRT